MFFPFVTLYILVRILVPETVLETGGTPGKSSCFILRAMEKNGYGRLFTIDLPPMRTVPCRSVGVNQCHEVLPEGKGAGWLVPEWLRCRYTLIEGTSREHLLDLLKSLGKIDIFIHDSEHSYENMSWEFNTVWKYLKIRGLLISDDIAANEAFTHFYESLGQHPDKYIIANYGIIKKNRK